MIVYVQINMFHSDFSLFILCWLGHFLIIPSSQRHVWNMHDMIYLCLFVILPLLCCYTETRWCSLPYLLCICTGAATISGIHNSRHRVGRLLEAAFHCFSCAAQLVICAWTGWFHIVFGRMGYR